MHTGILSPGLETQASPCARSGIGDRVNLIPQDGIREAGEEKTEADQAGSKKCLQQALWCKVFSGEAIKQRQLHSYWWERRWHLSPLGVLAVNPPLEIRKILKNN